MKTKANKKKLVLNKLSIADLGNIQGGKELTFLCVSWLTNCETKYCPSYQPTCGIIPAEAANAEEPPLCM